LRGRELRRTLASVDPDEQPPACCFDEWASSNAKRARKQGTAAPITRHLLAALDGERQTDRGLEGKTFLDVGCGTGDLALAALARGAASADGIDLGAGAIADARSLAEERGLADRATFTVGNGALDPLSRHDVVALNRVLCCYPSVDRLLANSLGAAGDVYAYTAPIHTGVVGSFNRISIGIGNAWYRLRDRKFQGFRAFVHDLDAVDRTIAETGFRKSHGAHHRMWQLAVFTRAERAA
jgi:SAM-dependent methyltransferase